MPINSSWVTDNFIGEISDSDHKIFFAAVETTRMSMIITDPKKDENSIIFANSSFIELTGYQRDEIMVHNCRFPQAQTLIQSWSPGCEKQCKHGERWSLRL